MRTMIAVKIKLDTDEHDKLKRCSAACGLSQSAFIRQLIRGKSPQPKPPKAFWTMLEQLYFLHDGYQKLLPYSPLFAEICAEIEQLVVDLQKEFTLPKPINSEKRV